MSPSNETLDNSIRVEAHSVYLPDQSDPEQRRFVFAYTIKIHNNGSRPAQLLTRHWLITDADGRTQEVHGDGVIGEQPEIFPAKTHAYSSGTLIETPVGTMEGRYGMVCKSAGNFNAPIPVFQLAVPGILN